MELERRVCAGEVRKETKDGKTRRRFIASDQTYDRYHTVLLADGWQLAEYRKNPIAFWAHESWKPPIGGNVETTIEESKLITSIEFADTEFAREIASLVDGGFLRSVSVGFRNLEKRAPTDEERTRFGIPADHAEAMILSRNELYEISVVGVPGNPNALLSKLGADEVLAEEMAMRGMAKMREKLEGRSEDAIELHPAASVEDVLKSEARITAHLDAKLDELSKRFTVRPAAQRSYIDDVLGLNKKASEINKNLRG